MKYLLVSLLVALSLSASCLFVRHQSPICRPHGYQSIIWSLRKGTKSTSHCPPHTMSHARIEEVSDSESDPSEGNISDLDEFDDRDILQRRGPVPEYAEERILPPKLSSATAAHPAAVPTPSQPRPAANVINPSSIPSQARAPQADGTQFQTTVDESKYKDFQCLYPVYFDKNRTRAEGRRVGKDLAVENPMAREIVTACGRLRLETLFEPAKTHPKDWSNPGRVKIKLKGTGNTTISNSESRPNF